MVLVIRLLSVVIKSICVVLDHVLQQLEANQKRKPILRIFTHLILWVLWGLSNDASLVRVLMYLGGCISDESDEMRIGSHLFSWPLGWTGL